MQSGDSGATPSATVIGFDDDCHHYFQGHYDDQEIINRHDSGK